METKTRRSIAAIAGAERRRGQGGNASIKQLESLVLARRVKAGTAQAIGRLPH